MKKKGGEGGRGGRGNNNNKLHIVFYYLHKQGCFIIILRDPKSPW